MTPGGRTIRPISSQAMVCPGQAHQTSTRCRPGSGPRRAPSPASAQSSCTTSQWPSPLLASSWSSGRQCTWRYLIFANIFSTTILTAGLDNFIRLQAKKHLVTIFLLYCLQEASGQLFLSNQSRPILGAMLAMLLPILSYAS